MASIKISTPTQAGVRTNLYNVKLRLAHSGLAGCASVIENVVKRFVCEMLKLNVYGSWRVFVVYVGALQIKIKEKRKIDFFS